MHGMSLPLSRPFRASNHAHVGVSRVEAEASVGQEEDDEEEEIGAADKDEQMCSAACLGRLSPGRSLAAVDAQVHITR